MSQTVDGLFSWLLWKLDISEPTPKQKLCRALDNISVVVIRPKNQLNMYDHRVESIATTIFIFVSYM